MQVGRKGCQHCNSRRQISLVIYAHILAYPETQLQISYYFIENNYFISKLIQPNTPHPSLSAIPRARIVFLEELDGLFPGMKDSFQLGILKSVQHLLKIGTWDISH